MVTAKSLLVLLAIAFIVSLGTVGVEAANLQIGFYDKSCPYAEKIVLEEMVETLKKTPSLAAPLLRMHFHDCFVRGCEGSVLLNSTKGNVAEKDAVPNRSLRGFGVVDRIKEKLEKACPGVVSCSDTLALIARDAVVLSGGKFWPVATGRRDGIVSIVNETKDLPPPTANITLLEQMFAKKGLDKKDIVVLSGAHTIGISHCAAFDDRLFNFTGKDNPTDIDRTLENHYRFTLTKKCKVECNPSCKLADSSTFVEMDPGSHTKFDTSYYKLVLKRRSVFHSDWSLLVDDFTRNYVIQHAGINEDEFFNDFAESMIKMGDVGVLTGMQGQIRKHCAVVN